MHMVYQFDALLLCNVIMYIFDWFDCFPDIPGDSLDVYTSNEFSNQQDDIKDDSRYVL